jgi:hypothetical protein
LVVLIRFAYLAVTNAFAVMRLLPRSDRDRDVEITHRAGALVHLASRLADHIHRVDEGNVAAADDLASVLRTLVCDGKGNHAVRTGCDVFGIRPPQLQISRAPETGDCYLALGSVPVPGVGAAVHGARTMGLAPWINEPLFRFAGGRRMTWNRFIAGFASKWGGSHLDLDDLDEFLAIERHTAAGLVLSTYLLRVAGVAVWDATQTVLRHVLPAPNALPDGIAISEYAFAAPGATAARPTYRADRGQIQWLTLGSLTMDFGWYVDAASTTNTLRPAFGAVPYDITYQNGSVSVPPIVEPLQQAKAVTVPSPARGSRHVPTGPLRAEDLRQGSMTGVLFTVQELAALEHSEQKFDSAPTS